MRPSKRLLLLALICFAITALVVAYGAGPHELALLPWAALAVGFLLDLGLGGRRDLMVSADAPPEVFTGVGSSLELRVRDRMPRAVLCRLDWPDGLDGPEEAPLWQDEAAGGSISVIPFTARRRGIWRIERAWLVWHGPLGLIEFTPRITLDVAIASVPDIRPAQSGEIDVRIKSELYGVKENPVRGEGSQFHQLREFVAGMDTRAIDWKRSARSRRLVAKEMRAERNHHVILAIDNGHLMRREIAGLPRVDHAVHAALALGWAAIIGGDQVGLVAYDAEPRVATPPVAGRAGYARIRRQVAALGYETRETNHTLGMTVLHRLLRRRALVVVFSDFVDSTTAEILLDNMKVLGGRHVVIFVALRDPEVERLAMGPVRSLDEAARSVAASELMDERRLVMERLVRMGVLVLDVPPERATARLISSYIDLKVREAI
jgi:uncharacterized protein (DUF58 family)